MIEALNSGRLAGAAWTHGSGAPALGDDPLWDARTSSDPPRLRLHETGLHCDRNVGVLRRSEELSRWPSPGGLGTGEGILTANRSRRQSAIGTCGLTACRSWTARDRSGFPKSYGKGVVPLTIVNNLTSVPQRRPVTESLAVQWVSPTIRHRGETNESLPNGKSSSCAHSRCLADVLLLDKPPESASPPVAPCPCGGGGSECNMWMGSPGVLMAWQADRRYVLGAANGSWYYNIGRLDRSV